MRFFDKIKTIMAFDVKITTLFRPLDLVAPFTCRGCGALGELLCERCKKYNVLVRARVCPRCGKERPECGKERLGSKHKDERERCECEVPIYAVSRREGVLVDLAEDYKYKSIRRAAEVLAELMDEAIGVEGDVIVVPLPTVARHIRERGFDHTWLLAKKLAKRHKAWKLQRLLTRRSNTVQVGTDGEKRQQQAKKAYAINRRIEVDPAKTYLLVDDVWTTGASMEAAISLLSEAGAKKIAGAVILIP